MKMDHPRMPVIEADVYGSACAASFYQAGINVTVLARDQRY
jgi:hypothetical protein